MWENRPSVQPSTPEYKEPEPPAPPPPPAPEFVDLTVPSDAVLGLQIERTVSSELARVEDKVEARVTRDVRVSDRIAIPAGSTVRGSVTEVEKGGRMKGRARLAIRFHTIVLADGTQVALKTDPVVREGQSRQGRGDRRRSWRGRRHRGGDDQRSQPRHAHGRHHGHCAHAGARDGYGPKGIKRNTKARRNEGKFF
jgi:hypothetical protein